MQIVTELRFRMDRALLDIAPNDYDQTTFGAVLAAKNLWEVFSNTDPDFRRLGTLTPVYYTGALLDHHPVYGDIQAMFQPGSVVSDWVAIGWDAPPEPYRETADSYNELWLFEVSEHDYCKVWDIWKYNVHAIPPNPEFYWWYVYFYRAQYHYKNFYIPCGSIIPLLVPIGLGVLSMLSQSAQTPARPLKK